MSFILDALKKSETDRQQQSTAEFASVPSSPPPAGVPRWMWVVGLLLAINILVLIGVLLRPAARTPTAASADISAARPMSDVKDDRNASVLQPDFAEQVETARQNRPDTQAAPSNSGPGGMPGTARPNNVPGSTVTDRNASEVVKPVLISQNPSSVSSENLYPSIQEVRANGLTGLPELHLDIHVYNADPADRFVFINMSKLREGATLSEGPVVTKITPDGVVLRHQGQSFLLPRE